MPELPYVLLYIEAVTRQAGVRAIEGSSSDLHFSYASVDPMYLAEGKVVTGFRRLGKRIVCEPLPRLPSDDYQFVVTGRRKTPGHGAKLISQSFNLITASS